MAKITKVDSLGFGYSKAIEVAEGLITGGIALTAIGFGIILKQTRWYSAGNKDTLDTITKLYDLI